MGRALVVCCLVVCLAGCVGAGVDAGALDTPEVVSGDASDAGVRATVTGVVDGDTVDVRLANGSTDRLRLLGVDTPEVHADTEPAEFEGVPETTRGEECLGRAGESASLALRERVAGESVRVVVDERADRRGSYGRLLAYLVHDGTDLNRWLVADGHARVYDSRFSRSEAYYEAESAAQTAGRGLWRCRRPGSGDATDERGLVVASMHADAAGNDHENLRDEYVVFENAGDRRLDLDGWTVSDAAGTTYSFPAGTTLAPGSRLTVHTGVGEDEPGVRFWSADRAVWNNGGDTVTVRDADGRTVLDWGYD